MHGLYRFTQIYFFSLILNQEIRIRGNLCSRRVNLLVMVKRTKGKEEK